MVRSPSRGSTTKPDLPGRPLVVDIHHLRPNEWNPNRQDEFIYQRELESIRRFGFVVPIIARTDPADKDRWEIIDGEHRQRAGIELGMDRVPIWDLGPIPDHVAKSLTIVLNETKGAPEPARLADLLRDLLDEEPRDSLLAVMPFTPSAFDSLLGLRDFDWKSLEKPAKEQQWVERTFRLPPDAAAVIDEAIERVRADQPDAKDWQALELIAADFLGGIS